MKIFSYILLIVVFFFATTIIPGNAIFRNAISSGIATVCVWFVYRKITYFEVITLLMLCSIVPYGILILIAIPRSTITEAMLLLFKNIDIEAFFATILPIFIGYLIISGLRRINNYKREREN